MIEAANIEVPRTGGGPGRLPAVAPLGVCRGGWESVFRERQEDILHRGLSVGKCVTVLGQVVRVGVQC